MSFQNLREKIINNTAVKKIWGAKTYIDIGIAPISWVTGKLPEIMSVVYLSNFFGYTIPLRGLIAIALASLSFLCIFGYFWKHTGMYDTEVWVQNDKNPYQREMLQTMREIRQMLHDKKIKK